MHKLFPLLFSIRLIAIAASKLHSQPFFCYIAAPPHPPRGRSKRIWNHEMIRSGQLPEITKNGHSVAEKNQNANDDELQQAG